MAPFLNGVPAGHADMRDEWVVVLDGHPLVGQFNSEGLFHPRNHPHISYDKLQASHLVGIIMLRRTIPTAPTGQT